MEFAAMKRRELLELCRQHGLATRGSKADLAASLAGAISGAAAAESVVEVVVGKGCLKRLGGSASGGTSGAAKKVRFALDKELEERARRRRSQVILQPVVTKTRGRRKARKIHPAAAVRRRGCRWKHDDVCGDSTDKDAIGEAGADAPLMWSTITGVCLCAHSEAESQNNTAEAEKEGEVFGAAIDRKWKQKTHASAEVIAVNAQAAGNKWRKRRGKPKAEEALPDTVVSGSPTRQKCDVGGVSVHHCAFADALVTQSRTEAMNLCPESGVECQNNPAEAEEEGLVAGTAIDSRKQNWKQKGKAQENAEGIAANARGGVSHGSTRKSSLSTGAVLLSAVVENKRRRRKVGNDKDDLGVEQTAQVQDLSTVMSPVDIENKRNRRNSEDCVPPVQKSGRTTRSHSVAAAAILPIVNGNKVCKTEHVLPDGDLRANSEVPRNDAPVTRSLRNRIVQVYTTVVEETHVGEKLEDKRKRGRPSTRRHQQLVSSVMEQQVAAPCDLPPLKQLTRNHPEGEELLSNATLGTNKLCRLPVAKDLKIDRPLTFNTANTSMEDFVAKAEKELGFTKRTRGAKRKNAGGVSFSGDSGSKAPAAKMELRLLDERTTCMHESVSGVRCGVSKCQGQRCG